MNKCRGTMIRPVKAVTDESGHWYVIPNEMEVSFFDELEDDDIVSSGAFDDKWGRYRTGGNLNLVQLFAKV